MTPVPPTPPSGTARPPLTTLDESARLRELAATLSTSQEAEATVTTPRRGDDVEARIERRFLQLEAQARNLVAGLTALLQSQARQLEIQTAQSREQKQNTTITKKGALASQIAAYAVTAATLFVAFSKALGDWGDAHPGAPITLTVVATAVIRAAAALAPRLAATADREPGDPPSPPPSHT